MIRSLHGKVYGRTIELDEDLGIAEGQVVEVRVRVISSIAHVPGDALARTAGALADDTEWDAIMEEIHRARRSERRTEVPDLGDA